MPNDMSLPKATSPGQPQTRATPSSSRIGSTRTGSPLASRSVAHVPASNRNGTTTTSTPRELSYRAQKDQYKAKNGTVMPFAMRWALKPTPDAKIDRTSLARMRRAEGGQSVLHDHNLNPVKNGLINDKAIVPESRKKIGEGKHNTAYFCQFRGKDVDGVRQDALKQNRIVKMAGSLVLANGNPASMVGFVGISSDKPRIPDRNVAASIVNERLGTTSVPHSSSGVVDGMPCVAMTVAPGEQATVYYQTDPAIVRDPDFQRQMSDVEVNAFLSGNPDPNPTNLMVGRDADGKVGVTMIDNDMCFGAKMKNPDRMSQFNSSGRTYHHTGLPAYMDKKTFEAVQTFDIAGCKRDLAANLTPDEIGAFEDRYALLKQHADFLRSENRIVTDWAGFKNAQGDPVAGGDFFSGTMQMSPVQQGIRVDDAPLFAPRSLICRDMMHWNKANFQHFPEMARLNFHHPQPLVPPSGTAVQGSSHLAAPDHRPASPDAARATIVPIREQTDRDPHAVRAVSNGTTPASEIPASSRESDTHPSHAPDDTRPEALYGTAVPASSQQDGFYPYVEALDKTVVPASSQQDDFYPDDTTPEALYGTAARASSRRNGLDELGPQPSRGPRQ